MPEELLGKPAYTGMKGYRDATGGYEVWLPIDWTQIKLKRNHLGMLFSPYTDDLNTSLLIEKHKLKYKVTPDDVSMLLESFHEGMLALPGVEVEKTEETIGPEINIFDARFTYLDGEVRRKRWVRNIYWGNGQLVIIAQGRTPENFEYWLPMFFNTITTLRIV